MGSSTATTARRPTRNVPALDDDGHDPHRQADTWRWPVSSRALTCVVSFTRVTDRQGSNFEQEVTETTESGNRHSVFSVSSCSVFWIPAFAAEGRVGNACSTGASLATRSRRPGRPGPAAEGAEACIRQEIGYADPNGGKPVNRRGRTRFANGLLGIPMAGRSFGTEVSSIAEWRCFGRGNEEANGELADAKSSPRVTGNRPDDDAGKRKDCWNIAGKDGPTCRVARYFVRYPRHPKPPAAGLRLRW